jgi:hypothetical protein
MTDTLLAEAIASGQVPASAVVEHHERGEYVPNDTLPPLPLEPARVDGEGDTPRP